MKNNNEKKKEKEGTISIPSSEFCFKHFHECWSIPVFPAALKSNPRGRRVDNKL